MPHTTTSARLLLTAAVLGLALTACSSTGGTSAPTPGSASGSASGAGSGSAPAPGTSPSGGTGGTATAPGGGGSVPTASKAAGPASCTGDHLAVSAGRSDGAAGHIGVRVIFRNTSGTPCALYGFPGVAGLDAKDKQQVQAARVTSGYLGTAKESVVVLAPGGTASALVGGVDVPSGNAASCPSYPSLLVTPPGTKTSTKVAAQLPGCPTMVVYPVVAGVPQP